MMLYVHGANIVALWRCERWAMILCKVAYPPLCQAKYEPDTAGAWEREKLYIFETYQASFRHMTIFQKLLHSRKLRAMFFKVSLCQSWRTKYAPSASFQSISDTKNGRPCPLRQKLNSK